MWYVIVIVSVYALGLTALFLRTRNRLLRIQYRFPKYPIPTTAIENLINEFQPIKLGPSLETEIIYFGTSPLSVYAGASDAETWILCTLAKKSVLMVEFGTCTGKTAYLWARNSPPEANIITITLASNQTDRYIHENSDSKQAEISAKSESLYSNFYYTGTDAEQKILQVFGDSKEFDETPYINKADLIFIDGSHAYSYVKSDTEKAMKMIKDGGVILWHDYIRDNPATEDVFRYLNELLPKKELHHIAKTNMVYYRHAE